MTDTPMTTIPTELCMALVKLLDVIPPVFCDWIETTGYGKVNARDRAALAAVKHAATLNEAWLAESGVSIDSLPVSLTQSDIERMKRQGYLGAGWAR